MLNETNFTIKVVPSPDVPVPDAGNYGLFSAGADNIGGVIAITGLIIILSILAFIAFRFIKKHRNNIVSHNLRRHFKELFSKRSFIATMSVLAIVTFGFTFVALKNGLGLGANAKVINSLVEFCEFKEQRMCGQDDLLSMTTEDIYMEAELDNEAVYVETTNTVTMDSATQSGYVVYALTKDNSDLLLNGEDGAEDKISAITTSMNTNPVPLEDNTWGVSLSDPTDQNSAAFRGLPSWNYWYDEDGNINANAEPEALLMKVAGTSTPANDSANFYYGAYLAPGLAYGEYSTKVVYVAITNPVVEEDVTINYHSNGFGNFSNGTDINTVKYNKGCSTKYLGNNCVDAYRDAQASRVVTLQDIKENGIVKYQSDGNKAYIYTVNIPGAEEVQVLTEHDFSSIVLVIVKGGFDLNAGITNLGNFDIMFNYAIIDGIDMWSGNTDSTQRVANYSGDTFSFVVMEASAGAIDDTANMMKSDIYVAYREKPNNKEVVPTKICNSSRTGNLDDNGTYYGQYIGDIKSDSITIPGADAIAVDVKMAIAGSNQLTGDIVIIGQGQIRGAILNGGNYNPTSGQIIDLDIRQNTSTEGTIIFEGDTVSFFYLIASDAIADYDYGFFARIRPVYDDPQNGSIPVLNCGVSEVDGSYEEPTSWKGLWDAGGTMINSDIQIKEGLNEDYEIYKGQTIDIYAYNPFSISYDGNGATRGTMDDSIFYSTASENNSLGSYNISLLAPNYQKDGYGFAGWSLYPMATVNDPQYIIYGPNQQVTEADININNFTKDNGKTATLYAVWVPADETQTMQTFSCSTLPQGNVIALRDERDNNVYTVAKLADGNCWMTENLRLDNTATLTAVNTDHPADTFEGLLDPSLIWCTEDTEYCINNSRFNNVNSQEPGDHYSTGLLYLSGPGKFNDVTDKSIGFAIGYQWYSYGYYYNWYAATAGTGTYAVGGEDDGYGAQILKDEDATGSICPAGWTLPIGGEAKNANDDWVDKSFAKLDSELNSENTAWRSFPNNFIYSGNAMGISGNRGETGIYISKTAERYDLAHMFKIENDNTYIDNSEYKYNGGAIRCVAE